jgi:hypothetical protein
MEQRTLNAGGYREHYFYEGGNFVDVRIDFEGEVVGGSIKYFNSNEEAREFFDKQGEPVHYDYDSLDELAKALGFNSWDEACSE